MRIDKVQPAKSHLQELSDTLKKMDADTCAAFVGAVSTMLVDCFRNDGILYAIGNGGSATQASHFAAEFIGRYKSSRPPLPAVSLTSDGAAMTCISNDYGYEHVYARQIEALGRAGDLLCLLSTSGTSKNIRRAMRAAQLVPMLIFAITGNGSGARFHNSICHLRIPSSDTAVIQEITLAVLHEIVSETEIQLNTAKDCQWTE